MCVSESKQFRGGNVVFSFPTHNTRGFELESTQSYHNEGTIGEEGDEKLPRKNPLRKNWYMVLLCSESSLPGRP